MFIILNSCVKPCSSESKKANNLRDGPFLAVLSSTIFSLANHYAGQA